MDKKYILSKRKASIIFDIVGSNRKRKVEAVGNVSKRKKNKESMSKSDLKLKEISDYVDSSEDVAKNSASGDSKESKNSERNSVDGDNDPLSVPSLSRFISVERYDLRTIMDEVESFPVKISVRSRMTAYRDFQQVLVDQELKKRFKRSYFGHLRNLSEHLKFNGQLVYYLLLRRVKNDKMRHEMWFCVNNKPACFVTKSKNITAANLLHLIRGNKLNEDQKFKCCLLWFLHTMFLAKNSTKVVDTKLIRMVDSLSFFENYPWGKEIFQLTLDYLKKKSDLKKQREVFDEKQKTSYALFGFPWAFMVWIYEAFPHLGKFVGKSMDEPFPIPRILRWHTTKSDQIIEGDPFKYKGKIIENVHPYIIPTLRETKLDYMIFFEPYSNEVKNNVLDGLKKELEGVTVLISNEDSDNDGDLGGDPVEVCVGDDCHTPFSSPNGYSF
ncbi:hypothetical protein P3S68_002550 [Capsicum galapagoense]